MVVDGQLRVLGVCELVVALSLGAELRVKVVVVEFLEVVCVNLVVGVIELVVAVRESVLYHLSQGCVGVGCELSHLYFDWLGCDLTLAELNLPWRLLKNFYGVVKFLRHFDEE